jgi:4-aminobutyrate aminotransferase-like enzyme/Ser/Thr protein kinase RdoA (MazF antagonist)
VCAVSSATGETPQLTAAQAMSILERHWGIAADRVVDLGSYEDQNLRVDADAGRYVLKVAGPSDARPPLEAEHAALAAAVTLELAIPSPVPARDGSEIVDVDGHRVRLLSWVEGVPLTEVAHLDEPTLRALGAVAAASSAALADVRSAHEAVASKWDPRLAAQVVDDVLADDPAPTEDERALLLAATAPLRERLHRGAAQLPALQTIHGDVTDYNVLVTAVGPGRLRISGLIDFGDSTRTWRIADLANACVAVVCRELDGPLHALLAVVAGYHEWAPLTAVELDALWPLILGRGAACAALSTRQLRLTPDSEYTVAQYAGDWRALRTLIGLPPGLADAAIRAGCASEPVPGDPLAQLLSSGTELLPVLAPVGRRAAAHIAGHDTRARGTARRDTVPADTTAGHAAPSGGALDLSLATDELHDGDWADPRAVAAAVHARHATIGRWGEVRLTAAGDPGDVAPDTLHLGADLFAPAGTGVRAPVAAVVAAVGEHELSLELLPGRQLRLAGVEAVARPGGAVTAGAIVAHVAERTDGGPTHVHVQLTTAPGQPGLGDARLRDAWLALCPDPSALIGDDVAAPPPPDAAAGAARRASVLAGAQELYYAAPMEIIRGSRQYLYDALGRPYLDMINNVAVVGHSHPRIAAAAAHQFRLLNTNSRFLYDSMTEYAARLSALLPAELDRVFLVNSGSEACDLALQLARVYTGRQDVVALEGAYHGWTSAVFEACTGPDNPAWRQTKPPFVHVAAQPDPYRGAFGDDAAAYIGSVASACSAAAAFGGVAAFISEPLLGNQGGVEPPEGFLAGAYEAVREAGGVCIADEIQVAYGRTGESFWAFEHERVTPDIVAVAKATGNGHPLGAVICRAEIAEALGRRAAFFSSTGGGPVSCEVGLAVLDAIADEGLQDNAARVGAALTWSLTALAGEHEPIGAVHGRGLYRGIDLVLDRTTREPAVAQARWICERMRELGVIVQPTGDHGNVLKVKPPLCVTESDAELFVVALDRTLRELR